MGKLLKGLLMAFAPVLIEAGAKAAGKPVDKATKPRPNG